MSLRTKLTDRSRHGTNGAIRSLLLSPVPTDNATDGTRIRAKCMASALARCGSVRQLCFKDDENGIGDVSLPSRPSEWERLLSPMPSLVRCFRSNEYRELVAQAANDSDVCFCVGLQVMQYATCLPESMPVVLDNYNVESDIIERLAVQRSGPKRAYWRLQAARLRRFEAWALSRANISIAISDSDASRFREIAPDANVRTIPPGVDLEPYYASPSTPTVSGRIVFIASLGWHVNVDAAVWIAAEVFPRILLACPDATLELVGRSPAREVLDLGTRAGVSIHADVPDILPWLSSACVVVAPLRYGSGVQTKVIEAMAAGKAVVTTSVGAEGITALNGEHFLVSDSADGFAERCVELLQNPSQADEMGARAREASRTYSFERLAEDTRRIIVEVCTKSHE